MDFLIADTFTGSLAKLTGGEQKAVKANRVRSAVEPGRPRHEFSQVEPGAGQSFLVYG